ncbi:hypothetical protein DY000_02030183 [Brassica cretica]|uniref:Uncharacterized protein n=1 Tax=Brassica cretica TaxID=69181 RepID=A0ABQ7DK22_BRACR|nr:hypothetical protein DY000_02030183 [Brassica cretica]
MKRKRNSFGSTSIALCASCWGCFLQLKLGLPLDCSPHSCAVQPPDGGVWFEVPSISLLCSSPLNLCPLEHLQETHVHQEYHLQVREPKELKRYCMRSCDFNKLRKIFEANDDRESDSLQSMLLLLFCKEGEGSNHVTL